MNSVKLMGRVTKDITLKEAKNGKSFCAFTIATNDFKNGKKYTDFNRIRVFGNQASKCAEFLEKGSRVLVLGSLKTYSYRKDGDANLSYLTYVQAQKIEFIDWKSKNTNQGNDCEEEDFKEVDSDFAEPF